MAIKEVDPVSRIEGHLGLQLEVNTTTNYISGCNAHGNLWRGFENFLIDREPNDAITFTQRICGVCPIPHATASTFAVDSIFGYSDKYITFANNGSYPYSKGVPQRAVHIRNLVYACEFLMSAITHFYHLVALSYVQGPPMPPWTPYFNDSYYHPFLRKGTLTFPTDNSLWSAVIKQYVKALRIRRLTFEAGAMFAGRMPMTSSFVAGGVTYNASESQAVFEQKCDTFFDLLKEVGTFIIKEYVPLVLALGALYPNYDNYNNAHLLDTSYNAIWAAGNQATPSGAATTTNTGWGAGCGNFLAWGAFPQPHVADQALAIGGGWMYNLKSGTSGTGTLCAGMSTVTGAAAKVEARLVEDISHSRYASGYGYTSRTTAAYPGDVTRTVPSRADGYSWLKAPRWDCGTNDFKPMEVGPLARMAVNGIYPVDGRKLVDVVGVTLPSGWTSYASYASGAALDSRMVDGTLLTGLVNAGLNVGATMDISGIVTAWILNMTGGLSTMDRIRGRAIEALYLVQCMIGGYNKETGGFGAIGGWIGELKGLYAEATYTAPSAAAAPLAGTDASGFGVSEAPRGALAHFISVSGNKITAYQCVVPTTWNGSPKSNDSQAGPIEQAVIGAQYNNLTKTIRNQANTADIVCEGGVEALRIAQSFDPCIACSVH